MNLLITSPSANAKWSISLHLYSKIWEISLKFTKMCFSCGHGWPGVLFRPRDLFWAPQPLSDGNSKMQICGGLCCVWPLAGEDRRTGVPTSAHGPFGPGSYASDGMHSSKWSDVPRAHLRTPPAYPRRSAGLPVGTLALSSFGGLTLRLQWKSFNSSCGNPALLL